MLNFSIIKIYVNMAKYFKFKIISVVLIIFAFWSCDEAEVADPISPDNYPVATFTSSLSGNEVAEGNAVTYTITLDKMMDVPVTFAIEIDDASTIDESDFISENVVIPAYSTQAVLAIDIPVDNVPEASENMKFKIAIPTVGERYLLNPTTKFPEANLTVKNTNDPTLLTIMFAWDSEDDIDIVTWSDTVEEPLTEWGQGGATSHNPEFDYSIGLADPVGNYYVSVMNWGAPSFNYTFTIGHPDGTNQTFTGMFESDNLAKYTKDNWTAWGGSYPSYRVLKVVNTGTSFTVTQL